MSAELPPGVGTVGEEMTRLLAALAARKWPQEAGDDRLRREEGAEAEAPGAQEHAESPPEADEHCTCGCHSGAVPMGQAQACSLCPLCQAIATLRSLNPELLDRLAQLAALAADTLRELAVEATTRRSASGPERQRPRPARPERVDIDVVDDPSVDARGGGEAQG